MAFPHFLDRRTGARPENWVENSPYMAALIAAAAILILTLALPPPIVLPVLSVLLIALAFGLAAIPRRSPRGEAPARWYVSGALAFLGFGAAFLTEPEHVLPLFEGTRRTP